MGSASSRGTERIEYADVTFDACDASEDVRQSALELVRRSKFPTRTVRLGQTYGRQLSIFIAQSLFFSRMHAMRKLGYASGSNLSLGIVLKGLDFRDGVPPVAAMNVRPCVEITSVAYMRFCACSLTTKLVLFLSCAIGDLQRFRCSIACHILNRVFSRSFIEVGTVSVLLRQLPIFSLYSR